MTLDTSGCVPRSAGLMAARSFAEAEPTSWRPAIANGQRMRTVHTVCYKRQTPSLKYHIHHRRASQPVSTSQSRTPASLDQSRRQRETFGCTRGGATGAASVASACSRGADGSRRSSGRAAPWDGGRSGSLGGAAWAGLEFERPPKFSVAWRGTHNPRRLGPFDAQGARCTTVRGD